MGVEELHQLALRLGGQEHLAVGREGLPALVSGPAQGVVGVVLVDLVKVFKDRGALDIERRDRAHQIPQALVVVLHLALAAEEEAFLWVLDAVQAAAADIARLVDGDAFAIHLPVADQKARRRERGDATADEIGRLPVHALRLAGTNERFVVTITVEHIRFSLWQSRLAGFKASFANFDRGRRLL